MKHLTFPQKCLSGFEQGLQRLIRWGGVLLFSILFFSSCLIQTVILLDGKEWADLSPTRIWVYLTLVGLIGLLVTSRKWLARLSNKQLFKLLTVLYLLAGIILLLITTDKTRDDAAMVFHSAVSFNQGNLSALQMGEYLFRYPHQLGLVTFERLVLAVFPFNSIVPFFVLNLFMVIGTNFATWKISNLLFKDERISKYTILLSFAFLPQFFNILFVYGLIFGLFFASFGIYLLLLYLENQQKRFAISAILAFSISYWIRNNFIFLILAIAIVLLLEAIRKKTWRPIFLILVTFMFSFGLSKATTAYYESLSGQDLTGTPKITWLAMGLQDNGNKRRLPGWYNYYVRKIYFEKRGDYKAVEADAKESIQNRLQTFKDDPAYTFTFFREKFLSTWTDSLFQSIWSGPSRMTKQPLVNIFGASLYHGGWLYRILYQYTHAILILIYAGATLFLLFFSNKDKASHLKLYAFIYLAGGVVFHLLWETKSQYASPYVYLLIPFAVAGFFQLFGKWQSLKRRYQKENI